MPRSARQTYAEVASLKSKTASQPFVDKDRNATAPCVNPATQSSSRSAPANAPAADKENTSSRAPRDRRPSEKIVAARTEQENALRCQQLLEANRAERAKRSLCKQNRANGVDRPAQSDDEERPDSTFTSQAVTTKVTQKAALVQRQNKVPPPAPAQVQRSKPQAVPATAPQQLASRHRSASPPPRSRHHSRSRSRSRSSSRSRSRSRSRQRGRRMPSADPPVNEDFEMDTREESCPHSPSPGDAVVNEHGKRARSPEDDAVDEITATFVKAQKVTESGGRPKASDYDEVAKEVILTATSIYRCLICTTNAFPTPSEEAEMIRLAWQLANEETAQEVPIALSPLIAKVVSARGSQVRGEVKNKALTYVETLYGFESGHGKSILKQNRQLAEDLKRNHSGYLYKNLSTESGLYQHPAIQKIVNHTWFNNPRDEGIVYADLFDPLSVEAIALVVTAIECGIDAWTSGRKVEVSFYSSQYKSIYISHVKTLKAFGVATSKHDLLGKLQRSLFNFGRIHAGVPSTVSQTGPMLSDTAFAAALKEYEEDTETEEDGEDLD